MMGVQRFEEVFSVASRSELAETGGGHNQKGVNFQRAWTIARMFELEMEGAQDYLFLIEAIQDIAELDSAENPTTIKIYQVKKQDRNEWDWRKLTNLITPDRKASVTQSPLVVKESLIGKLYASVIAFKELKSSGKFISNAGCNVPLEGGANAATSLPCDLSAIKSEYLNGLLAGLKTFHDNDADVDPKVIHLEKVAIHPDSIDVYLQGIVSGYLTKRSPNHAGQAKALVDALQVKIGQLGARTDSCSSAQDLIKLKGFSKNQFIGSIGEIQKIPNEEAIANTFIDRWEGEGVATFIEVTNVRISVARIYQSRLMGYENPESLELIAAIDVWIKDNLKISDLSQFIEKAKSGISSKPFTDRPADFIAHLLLRAAKLCVDPISENS